MLSYALFVSSLGWMAVVGSEAGIKGVILPQLSPYEAGHRLRLGYGPVQEGTAYFLDLCLRLRSYLDGGRVALDDPLDLEGATPFQQQVWRVIRSIPYGETRSYRWVAEQMGRSHGARAVGRALATNPVPLLVPCHRVVDSEGQGRGYQGGLSLKQYLLRIETTHSSGGERIQKREQ